MSANTGLLDAQCHIKNRSPILMTLLTGFCYISLEIIKLHIAGRYQIMAH